MRFTDILLEEGPDHIEVHDVTTGWQNGRLLWSCPCMSDECPPTYRHRQFFSTGNKVGIIFYTDGSVTARGWRLEWSEYSVISNKSIFFNVVLQA